MASAITTKSNISSTTEEVAVELLPLIRVYEDGSVERLMLFPSVPPSPEGDPQTGVLSKDVVISDNPAISARIYLPNHTTPSDGTQQKKLPILVYFHGGGFCVGSVFSIYDKRYLNGLVSLANCIAVCVEYRLAPEHPLPVAYDDCWTSLQWVASHSANEPIINSEPWLINHGNFEKIYIGGDSAGGNIVHNMAMRAGVDQLPGDVKIFGGFLSCAYFWGSEPIGSEPVAGHDQSFNTQRWNLVFPTAPGEIDNPMINPMVPGAPSLAGLGCSKLLVCVAGMDKLRERGVLYTEAVRKSGWPGELDLFEAEEEDHCFQLFDCESENSKIMMKRLASFIN